MTRTKGFSQRVLVVGPAWVGDMVMAQSLFKVMLQQSPGTRVDVLAPAWSAPLLARMPEVVQAIHMPLGHGELGIGRRRALGIELRSQKYDQAIVLPRSAKAALVPFFARIPHRTGYRGEMRFGLINDIRRLDKNKLPQIVQRFVNLGLPRDAPLPAVLPEPGLQIDEENRRRLLHSLRLSGTQPVVAMMPGAAYGPAKRWPVERFGLLAQRFATKGLQVWIFGSEKESELGQHIVAQAGSSAVNLCGRTELADVIDLLSLAKCAVSNDSGLMHMAAAVGIPVVAIYGSSTPLYTPPLTHKAEIVWLQLDCNPCFERECPLGHTNCLNGISTDQVAGRVEKYL